MFILCLIWCCITNSTLLVVAANLSAARNSRKYQPTSTSKSLTVHLASEFWFAYITQLLHEDLEYIRASASYNIYECSAPYMVFLSMKMYLLNVAIVLDANLRFSLTDINFGIKGLFLSLIHSLLLILKLIIVTIPL